MPQDRSSYEGIVENYYGNRQDENGTKMAWELTGYSCEGIVMDQVSVKELKPSQDRSGANIGMNWAQVERNSIGIVLKWKQNQEEVYQALEQFWDETEKEL